MIPTLSRHVAMRAARLVGGVLVIVTMATAAWLLLADSGRSVTGSALWRAHVLARKATGGLPDLSWTELWQMLQVRGGFGIQSVVADGVTLDGAVRNALSGESDVESGARIFRERCATCHGGNGRGLNAPPLNRGGFRFGDSDFSVYQVVRDGIPGTAMPAVELTVFERWRLVGYLTSLRDDHHEKTEERITVKDINVSEADLLAAGSRTDGWLTYSGSLAGLRHTSLNHLNPTNISRLRLRWITQFEDRGDGPMEATPLVVNGTLFTTTASRVVALDARSGSLIWEYQRTLPSDLSLCCRRVNRGLGMLGNTLFYAALDGHLVAIDANSGRLVWEQRVADPKAGYTLTAAPLVVGQRVVLGVAGGEFGVRGFLAAYDVSTGELQWRFNTIPGPGEFGHDTWQNDAWRMGGGATWITGAYDPTLDLLYWGVGNPAPNYAGDTRPGDNLFSSSVVALHARTGKLAWHFQFTPHDERDWDSNQTPILADLVIKGTQRQVICWANRNGFYYVLDRRTGEFLTGTPFVEQNWAHGLDAKGRPILTDSRVSTGGRLIKPAVEGGTNWQNPAYDETRKMVFVPATEGAAVYTKSLAPRFRTRQLFLGSSGSSSEIPRPVVRALDAATGTRKWEYLSPPFTEGYSYSGLLATGGGLVVGASGGIAFALDSTTGEERWRLPLGGDTRAAPISFTLDGEQVIVLSAGRAMLMLSL